MYYEDEKNLYHYSYPKNERPTERIYDPEIRSEPTPQKHIKKSRLGLKVTALALACALIGGAAGFGVSRLVTPPQLAGGVSTIYVSGEKNADLTTSAPAKVQDLTQVYKNVVGSVVSINCLSTSVNAFGQTTQTPSSGSGFVITADGYIVTNYHVVEGASSVEVTMYDGTVYEAEVIGGDEDYDIAVIKVEATGLAPVLLGNSDALEVGEQIAAIGNPLGELTFSMSSGIVSSVGRTINVDGTPFNMIQIDASINPGNSGGPLVNAAGEVVGIVSAKYSTYSTTMVEGIGFAIPMNDVIAMIRDIMTNGYVTNKPYLGITVGTLTSEMVHQYALDIENGVFVYSVEDGGAADTAGFKMGDVIIEFEGKTVKTLEEFTAAKKNYSAGDTATFTVVREGEEIELTLTFDSVPQKTEEEKIEEPNFDPNQGGQNPYYYYPPYDYFNDFFGSMFGMTPYGGYYR